MENQQQECFQYCLLKGFHLGIDPKFVRWKTFKETNNKAALTSHFGDCLTVTLSSKVRQPIVEKGIDITVSTPSVSVLEAKTFAPSFPFNNSTSDVEHIMFDVRKTKNSALAILLDRKDRK